MNLFWKFANGGGEEERLTLSQYDQIPFEVSPDGQTLVFGEKGDLWILPLTGDRKPRRFLQTPFNERGGSFSPDGHWLAYISDESGRDEVYVRPFPAGPGKWQISTEGVVVGVPPRWTPSGELLYRSGDKMIGVDLTTQPTLTVGRPRVVFEGRSDPGNFDVTPDGQRFLMSKAGEQEQAATQINVVLNWSEELKRRVPRR
jgi:Tol biopolymer transport system component